MASSKPRFELTVDQHALQALRKACLAEEDGKALRKELANNLKDAVHPGVSAVQGKLRAIPSSRASGSPALGSYLAARVKPQVRLTGRSTGVAIRIGKTPKLRGFAMAARRLNRQKWRHRVFGKDVWVEQESPIEGYFDETLQAHKAEYREAVIKALESMARRIAERVR